MSKPRKRRPSRAKPGSLPKGAFRVPTGGYVTRSVGSPDAKGRRIVVVGLRRDPVNVELLAKALLQLAADEVRRRQEHGEDITKLKP